MGAGGLGGLYPNAEIFGLAEVQGVRNNAQLVRTADLNGGTAYIAEYRVPDASSSREDGASRTSSQQHVASLLAIGCRGSDSARKYNLQHTVTIKATTQNRGGGSEASVVENEARAVRIVQSF
eukprot:CAMPEP_0198231644 /NCGR_PEP_ID=MMETSP1445-20131203/115310_1 /TAXON_ID=36898 /ORGANISM="Pyramimonas sp., Strain CCMP2087" /LENGTH=122 /DNA_ID=CAMNT_0043912271 /DNA_START=450 /DNA_END=815 /DNA_ORIENTATION=+